MFCVSYGDNNFSEFMDIVSKYSLVELRLDLCDFSNEQLQEALSTNTKIIVTNRKKDLNNEEIDLLSKCIDYGAEYIDIDVEYKDTAILDLNRKAGKAKCKIIISYHNYLKTPKINELLNIIINSNKYSPDIIKIACKVNSQKDNANLLSLYGDTQYNVQDAKFKLIVIGMGEIGKITRLASLYLGSPFTYVSFKKGKETANGQFDLNTIQKIMELIDYGK